MYTTSPSASEFISLTRKPHLGSPTSRDLAPPHPPPRKAAGAAFTRHTPIPQRSRAPPPSPVPYPPQPVCGPWQDRRAGTRSAPLKNGIDTLDWTDFFVGLTGELPAAPYEGEHEDEFVTPITPAAKSKSQRTKLVKKRGRATPEKMVENGAVVAEPAAPEVREELNLPPKSFADAVVEGGDKDAGEVNGDGVKAGEGETVLPKSFAEVVVE
ncbi:hypothetical protein V492_03027, partial [Pseudogymnoascus sp. VKM F-4246]